MRSALFFPLVTDGMIRNVSVFMEQMVLHGYDRSAKQCREKLKKLKSDCSGGGMRWYEKMDAIYPEKWEGERVGFLEDGK